MAETICPRCGFSPIPAEAELCPKCRRPFFDDRKWENTNITATRAGGLTGSVTASPGPIVIALIAGTVLWVVRAGGMLGTPQEPGWTYAIAALQVVAAMLLLTTSGPAKQAPALIGVIEALAAVALETPVPVTALCLAHGGGLVLGTIFEPAKARILSGGVFATFSAVACLAALPLLSQRAPQQLVVHDAMLDFTIKLPLGWSEASSPQLGNELTVPIRTAQSGGAAFKRGSTLAVFHLNRAPSTTDNCSKVLTAMKLSSPVESQRPAPALFGVGALVTNVQTASGSGSFACALKDGHLIALAVVSLGDGRTQGELEELARGIEP